MMAESVEIDVQEEFHQLGGNVHSLFYWVLRITNPVTPLFRSIDTFPNRADAIADWEEKKEIFKKAWRLMRDD